MTSFGTAARGPGPVSAPVSWILFFCSILFPGCTQIVYGIIFGCDCGYVLVGLLQIALSPFLIGWAWSIFWGFVACKGGAYEATEAARSAEDAPEAAPAPPAGEPEATV